MTPERFLHTGHVDSSWRVDALSATAVGMHPARMTRERRRLNRLNTWDLEVIRESVTMMPGSR